MLATSHLSAAIRNAIVFSNPELFSSLTLGRQLHFAFDIVLEAFPFAILGLLALRSAKNRDLIDSKMLLLVASYTLTTTAYTQIYTFVIGPQMFASSVSNFSSLMSYLSWTGAGTVVTIFLLHAYYRLRLERGFDVIVPRWARAALLFYSIPRIAIHVYFMLLPNFSIEKLFSAPISGLQNVVGIVLDLAIFTVALFPLHFTIAAEED